MVAKGVCENCIFYEESGKRPISMEGFCRKYAPKPIMLSEEIYDEYYFTKFPLVAAQDWCGEFEQKEGEQDA
jgi:hypothetical protein